MRFLFDRLCEPLRTTKSGSETDLNAKASLFADIRRELARITQQRQYFAGAAGRESTEVEGVVNFGINRGIGELRHPDRMERIAHQIRVAVLRYEPRLLRPSVRQYTSKDDEIGAGFEVSGYVRVDDKFHVFKSSLGDIKR